MFRFANVSNECKDLLSKVIVFNPQYRLSAHEALNHSWFSCISPYMGIENTTLIKLRNYQTSSKALRICLKLLAYCANPTNKAALTEKFLAIDPQHCGAITYEGLRKYLSTDTASDQEIISN